MGKLTRPPAYWHEHERALHPDASEWSVYNVHDPSIFKDGDTYYILSTDTKTRSSGARLHSGVQIRKSVDLIHWEWAGLVFDGVPPCAYEWTAAKGLWAPEVVKRENTYYLYYSASQFGKNRSFIGVATSNSMEGPWEDHGEVIKTSEENKPNAIDPNIVTDRHGDDYLVYGSFFGGVYLAPLDKQTGKLAVDGEGTCIARREHETKQGAVEGPFMIYHPGFDKYYLFVSYDSLFSNYHIRVGRSESIAGPFVDFNGRDLCDTAYRPADEVGNKLLAGYCFQNGGWKAPGHNSILEENGEYFIVHHARMLEQDDIFCLHIRRLLWTDDGWPLVSPERYAGERMEDIPEKEIAGSWEVVVFDRASDGITVSSEAVFTEGTVHLCGDSYRWKKTAANTVHLLKRQGNTDSYAQLKLLLAWDWEKGCETLVFTGMDNTGTHLFGKK
ncbi:arabinan endo-1,5-alpha-L-arabinosidase [Evansella caseinilytica]|uniref:Arabinan endo-1,5-alpha-L-arabinosidase n=1 Tax=Evansella caseinilytica TaxID=1503961 RepID=A0A1H3TD60_9BACI|nr:arabinan endo-1,5-alpha-L-arabinosidase [Evansella caseinilytica]SDZ48146.1 arabinan endo-1,5-alpha-L-arabinosidase [Evansella caseinilytica]